MNANKEFYPRRRPFFLLIPVFIFGLSGIVMLLWNALLPDIIHVSPVNYWQAMGILVLSKILFGGFRFGGGRFGPPGGPPFGRHHLRQRWMQMTDEEKARFKDEWKRRCGDRGKFD